MGRPGFSRLVSEFLRLEVETPAPAGTVLNFLENPTGQQGTYQWVSPIVNTTLDSTTSSTYTGPNAARVVRLYKSSTSAGTGAEIATEPMRAYPGEYVGASFLAPWAVAAFRPRLEYLDANYAVIGTATGAVMTAHQTTRRLAQYNAVAPAATVYARLIFAVVNTNGSAWNATGYALAVADVMFTRSTVSSTEAAASAFTTEYAVWTNILGTTHRIATDRVALDVGTLAVTVLDATLDPATGASIRPGRRVRLGVIVTTGTAAQPLFTGVIREAAVTYHLTRTDTRRARITISAVDNVSRLAKTNRPLTPQSLAFVPALLEGAGVPWDVDNNKDQNLDGGLGAYYRNDSSSALDQITLLRDSQLGHVWVDRSGVLTVRTTLATALATTLTEADYGDLDVDFNTDRAINSVRVSWLKYTAGSTTETEEVSYGPYRDNASIRQWDERPATFSMQGNLSATIIANRAAAVLAANATPQVTVSKLTMPIRNDTQLGPTRALLDLYAKVRVVNTANGVDVPLRVVGISHQISQRWLHGVLVPLWTVALELAPDGTVALPTLQPGAS